MYRPSVFKTLAWPALLTALTILPHSSSPTAAPPIPEASSDRALGDPGSWQSLNVKRLDPVYDGKAGRASDADIMGFHADQETAPIARTSSQMSRPDPTSGPTPMSSRFFTLSVRCLRWYTAQAMPVSA